MIFGTLKSIPLRPSEFSSKFIFGLQFERYDGIYPSNTSSLLFRSTFLEVNNTFSLISLPKSSLKVIFGLYL